MLKNKPFMLKMQKWWETVYFMMSYFLLVGTWIKMRIMKKTSHVYLYLYNKNKVYSKMMMLILKGRFKLKSHRVFLKIVQTKFDPYNCSTLKIKFYHMHNYEHPLLLFWSDNGSPMYLENLLFVDLEVCAFLTHKLTQTLNEEHFFYSHM